MVKVSLKQATDWRLCWRGKAAGEAIFALNTIYQDHSFLVVVRLKFAVDRVPIRVEATPLVVSSLPDFRHLRRQ